MNSKGFIQIPLLIIIIALIVVVSAGAGFVLHKQGKLAPFVANASEDKICAEKCVGYDANICTFYSSCKKYGFPKCENNYCYYNCFDQGKPEGVWYGGYCGPNEHCFCYDVQPCNCSTQKCDNTGCVGVPKYPLQKITPPTCSISFTPNVIRQGESIIVSWSTVDNLVQEILNCYGVLEHIGFYKKLYTDPEFLKHPSGEITLSEVGEGSCFWTVRGPGGDHTCSASIEVLPKLVEEEQISSSNKEKELGKPFTLNLNPNEYNTFNLAGDEKLHCIAADLAWVFTPGENTSATVLFGIKNPYKAWYRVKVSKTPQILPGDYNYSNQQIRNCEWEPSPNVEELKYWLEGKYIPENIKSYVADMEIIGQQTLGSISFRIEKNTTARECPSFSCVARWLGGWGGIATVVKQDDSKDWYKVIISNVDVTHFSTVGAEAWMHESIIPENVKQEFAYQKEQISQTEEEQTPKEEEEIQDKSIILLSFLKNKNFQTNLIIVSAFIVFSLMVFLMREKIKIAFRSKEKRVDLRKKKLQISYYGIIVASLVVIGLVGTAYGIVDYQKTSKLVETAEQLTKEEKYNEAIEKLEIAQNGWLTRNLGLKKQEIETNVEKNKKLFEDKLEYAQGVEEFNKENWEEAKNLLSKVSDEFPYYQDAENKIEDAQNNIVKKQITEAIEKTTKETKQITEEAQRQTAKLEEKVRELQQKQQSFDEPVVSTSLLSSDINKIISSVVYVICKDDYYSIYFNEGSGSIWQFSNTSGYFIFTNAHVISTSDGSDILCVVLFPELPLGTPYYLYKTEFYSMGYTDEIDWALLKLTTPYKPQDALSQIPLLTDYPMCKFSDVNIGDKVTIFGYPAAGGENITVTEGNISGFWGNNYKVSSGLIDKGNSGGAAILNKKKCSLGIPTWFSKGEASSVGIIQSWRTVYGDLSK